MNMFLKQMLLGLGLSAAVALAPAHAAIVYQTGLNTVSLPNLTGYATNGAMMDGVTVTATFTSGYTQSLLWGDTGSDRGAVVGSGWRLGLNGDTYTTSWVFANNGNRGQLASLTLDGRSGLTVFDRRNPDEGTEGSAHGLDWECRSAGLCDDALVFYDYAVGIGTDAPLGDLFQLIVINFGQSGPSSSFRFGQDTDNNAPPEIDVPEPGTLMLLGAAAALAGVRSRRSV